ncbi:hypothetical protein [Pedobacter sp. V48]|uniref:hypothetical protein n=1 Tax=Pedobacter sp. V48 TaxID=509635 RepID=UPI0003E58898|nr:hypothetical protein [Pedobacter sp. V48]ETZ22410.1 hypothetical protein N824_01815 [Pedobacter sp. V48]
MNKRIVIFAVVLIVGISGLKAQTNIGSRAAADASAQLQITNSLKGVLMPKVLLTATTTFTLTGDTKTDGMVVYNTNAGITGTATYPAYGTGWKGTPVVSTLPQTVLVAWGSPSAFALSASPLDLVNVPLNITSKMTKSGNTLTFVVAGTYKIDAMVQAIVNYSGNASNLPTVVAQITNSTTSTVLFSSQVPKVPPGFYSLPISYVGSFTAGAKLILEGRMSSGTPSNTAQFQVTALEVQQIN